MTQAPGAVFHSDNKGIWRGVPFWQWGHLARCFILCESLLNWTPIGMNNFIFVSVIKIIFLWYEDNVFLCPYRGPNQEWLRHLARCFILTQGHVARCFILKLRIKHRARCPLGVQLHRRSQASGAVFYSDRSTKTTVSIGVQFQGVAVNLRGVLFWQL